MLETRSILAYQPNLGGDNGLGAGNQQERSDMRKRRKSSETNMLPLGKKFRVRDMAYLAGFLDGEGCISAHFNGGSPYAFVRITNTDRSSLEWIEKTFCGWIQEKSMNNCPPNWKISYVWNCDAKSLIPLLKMLVPHLKLKRPQAYKAMAIRAGILNKISLERTRNAIDELKGMNKRGR